MESFIPFLTAIRHARASFPAMRFAGFHNLWQIAHELKCLNALQKASEHLEQQGQYDILKIIQTLTEHFTSFQCAANTIPLQQIQFSSLFSLVQQATQFYKQGFILVCDDLNLWEQIRHSVSDHHIHTAVDWIEKLYTYTIQKNWNNSIEILRHPLLKNVDANFYQSVIKWEYVIRKNQQQSIDENNLPDHPLCHLLMNRTFGEIFHHLPFSIQQQLPVLDYIPLIDSTDHCLEWFKGAVALGSCPPQIRLGLHAALEFSPCQVIFCLKQNQIRPLKSQFLFKKSLDKNLTELLFQWKGQTDLNILGYTQEAIFHHPFVQSTILERHHTQKLSVIYDKPIVNPDVSSRPTIISATGFNQLMQDPYGFYARYILKLRPLERTGSQSLQQEFGLTVHKIVEVYLKQGLEDALKYFNSLKLGKHAILWKGRILRILQWVNAQINELAPLKVEIEKDLQASLGSITLKARVDACVLTNKGNLVVNFKTGNPPSKTDATNGYAPQLVIEMFLVNKTYTSTSTQAEFWQLKGTQPVGSILSTITIPIPSLHKDLEKIALHYLTRNTPFLACPWPSKTPKYNDYKYLERIA